MDSVYTHIAKSPVESLLIFAVVFICVYWLYRRYDVSYRSCRLPPALPSLPVVGSLPFLPTKIKDLAEFCISPRNKLGKVFSYRFGSRHVVIISGKKAIYEALVTRSTDFADRPVLYLQTLVNKHFKGIFVARYDSSFRSHHQLCLSILKSFGFGQRVMETRILMEVEEMIGKVREEQGRPFDVKQLTTSCVANVTLSMLFGRHFDHTDPSFQQLISDVSQFLTSYSIPVQIFPLLRFFPSFKKNLADNIKTSNNVFSFIDNNIALCSEKETMTDSFVKYFIEAQGPDYDQEQLLFTLRDLLGAGMETTATAIRWAIVLLTNHVSVQERLHAEIDSVIGRQRLPTLDDRSRLPFVEATILEVLRYKTIIPLAFPHCTLTDTEVGGYFIPRGTTVLVNLWSAHMDPDDWQQPQQFRPERFLDESGNVINRDRIIPFSLGKRSCLGEQLARQEIFLFLVSLLQNFYFKPPEGEDSIDVHEIWGLSNVPSVYKVRLVVRHA